jgi:hypothetical protein
MKIVKVDNFVRDTVSDILIADNVPIYYALDIANYLNEKFGGRESLYFFRAVSDDYKLYVWEP